MSMAFYVMVFVYIVVKLGTKGIYKSVLLGIICVIGLVIFVNINFESPALTMIQSRIDFRVVLELRITGHLMNLKSFIRSFGRTEIMRWHWEMEERFWIIWNFQKAVRIRCCLYDME